RMLFTTECSVQRSRWKIPEKRVSGSWSSHSQLSTYIGAQMKRIFFVVVLFLVAGMFVAVSGRAGFNYSKSLNSAVARLLPVSTAPTLSQTQYASYNNTLTGDEINAGRPDVITVAADAKPAEGESGLPGHLTVTIRFNRSTNAVIGGDWVFTVMPGTDGSTLHGTVANGSVILNEAGKV